MTDDAKALKRQIGKLEDELKAAERRVAEIKVERDEATELVERMREHVEDADRIIESWIEAFDMRRKDDGDLSWAEWVGRCEAAQQNYVAIVREWNRFVPDYNRVIATKSIGRPLDASDAQVAQVKKLHKVGASLRGIVEETGLSFQTVRTMVGREACSDRTSRKRLERIDPDRAAEIAERSRKRTRSALPKRIDQILQQGAELLKEAKGIIRRG